MARISTYQGDTDLTRADKLIGTDSSGSGTKNFSLGDIGDFLSNSNAIGIAAQFNFKFVVSDRGTQTVSLDPLGEGDTFDNTSRFVLSRFDNRNNNVSEYLKTYAGRQIILVRLDDYSNFGIFNVSSVVDHVSLSDYLIVNVENVINQGSFIEGKYYGLSVFSGSDNLPQVNESLDAFQLRGTSLGRFNDGDTIPAHESNNERWIDIGSKRILPGFTSPSANITASTNPNNSTEVGTTLSNVLFTASLIQNDGGEAVNFRILKDNENILNDNLDNDIEQTFTLSKTSISFKSIINYAEGTNTKLDNFGDEVENPIEAGSDESGVLQYVGYYPIFYGSAVTKVSTPAAIRNNLTKRLENSGNTFILNTGDSNVIYQLWLPPGKVLSSVIDLDALNAVITSSYIMETASANDAGGNPLAGKLYTMEQDVAYTSNHRHQITITNE